ncbi:hypothetical protein IFM89_031910 [Coptis chinensis]|uniref:Uncharacterized protein n=1 Tax=Coptis chinensis TaxID=261450 RepID=A0A835IRR1_9MAGN|nr:hypothetical protein IFM89_031910 [Coptis chinensis]
MNVEGSASVATFDASWVISIRMRLEKQSHPAPWNSWNRVPPSIYRVPNVIHQVDVDAYEPKVLSIGPLHRGNPKLAAMEKHKWRYLHDLLSSNPEFSLEKC